MTTPLHQDAADPSLGAMLVPGGTIEAYEDGAARSGIADVPARGMVMHWCAQLPEGTITGSLWRERQLAEHFMAEVLADAFTELIATEQQHQRQSPDYSYSMLALVSYIAGVDAESAIGRKIGGADGAVLVRPRVNRGGTEYRAIAGSLGLDDAAPAGMISHVGASEGETVRWNDLWLDAAAPAAFYEEGGIDPDSLEILPLHTVFVNADELSKLPRFPRGENHLHF